MKLTHAMTWEEAYLRFETPDQEIRKFHKRLVALGAGDWPRDSRIVELLCGRGSGLRALRTRDPSPPLRPSASTRAASPRTGVWGIFDAYNWGELSAS